jgi:acylphosphatase
MSNDNQKKRIRLVVYGLVQGVFFRAHTRDVAVKLGVKGIVRNLYDGTVEIIAEGTEQQLIELIGFAKKGPPSARVYDVDIQWEVFKGEFNNFTITY